MTDQPYKELPLRRWSLNCDLLRQWKRVSLKS